MSRGVCNQNTKATKSQASSLRGLQHVPMGEPFGSRAATHLVHCVTQQNTRTKNRRGPRGRKLVPQSQGSANSEPSRNPARCKDVRVCGCPILRRYTPRIAVLAAVSVRQRSIFYLLHPQLRASAFPEWATAERSTLAAWLFARFLGLVPECRRRVSA